MSAITFAVAFPKHEADRLRVRALAKAMGVSIPQLYPHGIERPCMDCGTILDVGPRVAAILHEEQDTAKLYCPFCVAPRLAAEGLKEPSLVNLQNPDSLPEEK